MYIKELPRQLTSEEEKKCIKMLGASKDKKAREVLINHNLRLVAFIITKFFSNTKLEFDDLFSIGTLGLIKGVDSYSPEKNIKLATYVTVCIKNEILMNIRKNSKYSGNVVASLDAEVGYEGNKNLCLGEIVADKKDLIAEADEKMDRKIYMSHVNKTLNKMNEKHRKVFEQYWGINGEEKLKQSDIGEKNKMSQSYVSRVKDKVFKEVQKEMAK